MDPRRIAHSALYLSISIILPILFHQFGIAGRVFLPMHIPVLICGFTIGAGPAVIVGLLAPLLSHLMTSMPPAYAVPLMTMELPLYGLAASMTYRHFKLNIYLSLLIAMIVGRLIFAFGLVILGQFIALPYNAVQYFAVGGAVISGIPGIIIQFIIIPPLVISLKRMKHLSKT